MTRARPVRQSEERYAVPPLASPELETLEDPQALAGLDAVDARLKATFFDPARTREGADAWDARAQEGAELGFADAIAYALEEASA